MNVLSSTSRLSVDRSPLLSRKISHNHASCSRVFQCSACPPKLTRRTRRVSENSWVTSAQAAQQAESSVAFQSVDDSVWDERYEGESPLQYGLATLQGPRDEMEDYASIVPKGRCGFLYAGAGHFNPLLHNACIATHLCLAT